MRRPPIAFAAALLGAAALTACSTSDGEADRSNDVAASSGPTGGSSGPSSEDPHPERMEPDLAALLEPQEPRDELPAATDALTARLHIDPATSRRMDAPGPAEFYAARGPIGQVCLVVVLPTDADAVCGQPFDLQVQGIYAQAGSDDEIVGGHLVPDAVAGTSNIVLPTDDDSDPTDQLDADGVAETGFVLAPAIDLTDNETEPDLARFDDPATPEDELPEVVRGFGLGILPDTARWLGGNELHQFFVVRTDDGGLCFIIVLPGKTSGIGCTTIGAFHAYGSWLTLSSPEGSTQAWLVPDAVAGESNVVDTSDDAPDPIDQLDPDGLAETDFRIPPSMGEEIWRPSNGPREEESSETSS